MSPTVVGLVAFFSFSFFLLNSTVVALPRLIELRSQCNKKLLRCVKEEGELKGFVQFSGEQSGGADTKFEVHISKTGNDLVHIRSTYNNKYLVLDKNNLIAAKAGKPEEDQSKRSCTLFRPTSVGGNPNTIRLFNVHLRSYLNPVLSRAAKSYYGCVVANYITPASDSCDVFDVIDWQTLVILPQYVVFKGDNGKFLRTQWQEDHAYLEFSQTKVEDNPMYVGNEIVPASDGRIRIRSLQWDAYWRLSPSWIWADSKNTTSDDTLFEPVKLGDDMIAVRNVANKRFCNRLTTQGKESCLNAGDSSITSWSRLNLSELVISRKIENINFRLMDARIYGESIVSLSSRNYTNGGSTNQEHTFDLSFTKKTSSTWNVNLSMKTTIQASFTAGVPLIIDAGVSIQHEFSGEYTWGETEEVEEKTSDGAKFTVLPNTRLTARMMATRGTCDVPFSYTQRDLLYTGKTCVTDKDDGVYTGVSSYHLYVETKCDDLDPKIRVCPTAGFKKVGKMSPSGVMTPL